MKQKIIFVAFAIVVIYLIGIQSESLAQYDSTTIIKCEEIFKSNPAINFDMKNNIYVMMDGKILKYNQTGSLIYSKTLDSKGLDPSFNLDSEEYLHIVYSTGYTIIYNKLGSNGKVIFSMKISNDSELSYQPNIVIDSNDNIHITWLDLKSGAWEIWYTKYNNMGYNLIDEKNISLNDGYRSSWMVTSCLNTGVDSDNNIHIVWDDIRDFSDYQYLLYYTKLDNNGNTIIDDKRISNISNSNVAGILIDSEDNINIIWTYNEYNQTYDREPSELHFTKMDSNGNLLIADKILVSQDFVGWPSFDIDSNNNIKIVWDGGYRELYYDPQTGYHSYVNCSIYTAMIDNNGYLIENATKFVDGDGYTALSFNYYDSPSILWSNNTGNYLSLPQPFTLENNEINTGNHIKGEIYITIGILILVLIIILITYIVRKSHKRF